MLDADENLRLAVTQLLQIIGEAARRVSPEFAASHPEIPRAEIRGMRHKLLASLPAKLPTLVESEYLEEAPRRYKANAPRAAIVMTWNLTYAHLCDHVVRHKPTDFDNRWQQQYKGDHTNGLRAITVDTDFADEELGELVRGHPIVAL